LRAGEGFFGPGRKGRRPDAVASGQGPDAPGTEKTGPDRPSAYRDRL
jgi:hypothetical protein